MKPVLIVYYSRTGSTKRLADAIAQGVTSEGVPVIVRTVPAISSNINEDTNEELTTQAQPSSNDAPFVTPKELADC